LRLWTHLDAFRNPQNLFAGFCNTPFYLRVVDGYKKYYAFFMVANQLFSINFKPELLKTSSVDFTEYEHNF
jgi:hypothetical protein